MPKGRPKNQENDDTRIVEEGGNNPDQRERSGDAPPEGDPDVQLGAPDKVNGEPPEPNEEDEAVATLKAQLEEERRGKAEAERRASVAEQEAQRHRQEAQGGRASVAEAQLTAVSRALDASNATISNLKASYAQAMRDQDFDKVAEIQGSLSEEAAKKVALERGKAQLEEMQKNPPQEQELQPQGDPFEVAISRFSPRTQSWIRKHREVLTDQKASNLAQSAHFAALAAGHLEDSDAYFDAVDEMLGYKKGAPVNGSARRPVNADAPVSRAQPNSGARTKELRVQDMTPHMHEIAGISGLTPEEFVKNYNAEVASNPDFKAYH